MTKDIFKLIDELITREGGYVNDPNDSGGETKYGITETVARKHGYKGNMVELPRSFAAAIYRTIYWVQPGFKSVSALAPTLAAELFDTAVNMGPKVATEFLQRSLNALNRSGRDYPDIIVDGAYGPSTNTALTGFMQVRGADGEAVLLKAVEALQGERYIHLAELHPKNETFLYGWLRTRIGNEA